MTQQKTIPLDSRVYLTVSISECSYCNDMIENNNLS